ANRAGTGFDAGSGDWADQQSHHAAGNDGECSDLSEVGPHDCGRDAKQWFWRVPNRIRSATSPATLCLPGRRREVLSGAAEEVRGGAEWRSGTAGIRIGPVQVEAGKGITREDRRSYHEIIQKYRPRRSSG